MADVVRIGFVLLFGLGFVGTVAGYLRFLRDREAVAGKVGPVPTPGPIIVTAVALAVLVTGSGEIAGGWPLVRVLGVALGVYAVLVLPLAVRALGRFGVPGVAVLDDQALVTSGPYRHVRHPGYSAVLALWLGAALATLNWVLLMLWPLLVVGLLVMSREEEGLLRATLGLTYEAYTARTGRFMPRMRAAVPRG
ncbi:MAG: isoprenylcysteine carboxylmethyltransferase family protein [Actinomycetota bacterium]|nr:isoprenylcysteine carboxylmethyltransferase family protein [Actinomycetota bacterium]